MKFRPTEHVALTPSISMRAKAIVVLLAGLLSGAAVAQQAVRAEPPPMAREPAPVPEPVELTPEEREQFMRRAEKRRERQIHWLREANGALTGPSVPTASNDLGMVRGLRSGLSPEERSRLRVDIREAGYSAYAGPSRGRP